MFALSLDVIAHPDIKWLDIPGVQKTWYQIKSISTKAY
jgi:hypothetical protein